MIKPEPAQLQIYAAFLRGINVGGRVVKMEALKKILTGAGFRDVKTIGASGNVLLTAAERDAGKVVKQIESALQKGLGHAISVMVRSLDELRALAASDPFKSVKVTPETRLYVTFLAAPTKSKSSLAIPYQAPAVNMRILKVTATEIISVVVLSPAGNTIEAMEIIEKEFGKNVTTRNWNTIKKIL